MYCGTSGLRDFMYADIMEMAQFSVIMFSFATILRTFVMIYILDPLSEIMVRPERVLKFQHLHGDLYYIQLQQFHQLLFL